MNIESSRIRSQFTWSKAVRKNGNGQCECCGSCPNGSYDSRLEAHHLIPKSKKPSLMYDVENGSVLCHACHMKVHRKIDMTYTTDGVLISFTKAEYERIAAAADSLGMSVNTYINSAIDEKMNRDGGD